MSINSLLRWFLTLLIIVIACVFCYIRYNAYFRNPWPRRCPTMDLVELTGTFSAASPNASLIALVSNKSL